MVRQQPLTAIIVGAGHRAMYYASYALEHPDRMQIVGVADPSELRRRQAAAEFGLSQEQCFESSEELARKGKLADVTINGTMDDQHVPTSLPLLEAGYDLLVEKPFATSEEEMWALVETARRCQRRVMVCHVLRYAPFYAAIRRRVAEGEIGEITHIQTSECVPYHHVVVGYVRGKWNRRQAGGSSMLMAKCCHDLDLIAWMKSGIAPRTVASFGNTMTFRAEKAPAGAGTRCLVDCPIEPNCDYSARKHYLDNSWWGSYVWAGIEHIPNPTLEQKTESLKTDNPFGRCVWRCDNDVVDHQAVAIEFADGCVATHSMIGGSTRSLRAIHLIGTTGEIQGVLEEDRFVVRHMDPRPGHEYAEQEINPAAGEEGGGHGGGDLRLVEDFVAVMRGETPSLSTTSLEDSVSGHRIGFSADRAREERRVVEIARRGGADRTAT